LRSEKKKKKNIKKDFKQIDSSIELIKNLYKTKEQDSLLLCITYEEVNRTLSCRLNYYLTILKTVSENNVTYRPL